MCTLSTFVCIVGITHLLHATKQTRKALVITTGAFLRSKTSRIPPTQFAAQHGLILEKCG